MVKKIILPFIIFLLIVMILVFILISDMYKGYSTEFEYKGNVPCKSNIVVNKDNVNFSLEMAVSCLNNKRQDIAIDIGEQIIKYDSRGYWLLAIVYDMQNNYCEAAKNIEYFHKNYPECKFSVEVCKSQKKLEYSQLGKAYWLSGNYIKWFKNFKYFVDFEKHDKGFSISL